MSAETKKMRILQRECEKTETRTERYYEGFYFDNEISDSEFEIDNSIEKEIVDASLKFD